MRLRPLLLVILLACSSTAPDAVPEPADVPDVSGETPDVPDVAALDVPDAPDVPDVPDVPKLELPGPDTADTSGPTAPLTPLVRWFPATVGGVLAMADSTGLRLQLIGGNPNDAMTFAPGEVPTSPVGIAAGLFCWDIDKDTVFDLSEDYDGDSQPTPADCALHPGGPSPGLAGFLIAVNSDAGCALRAMTTASKMAWETTFSGTCETPTIVNEFAIVAVSTGSEGLVRLVDARSGAVKNQVSLPGAPTTPAAALGDGKYAIGFPSGIATIGVATAGGTGIFVTGTAETGTERPTAIFRAGFGRMGVATRRPEDPAGSLGSRLRIFLLGDTIVDLHLDIVTPGPIWASPISGLIADTWTIAAGGTGWVTAWNPTNGAKVGQVGSSLGTFMGISYGTDGNIYTVETTWNGDPALRGGDAWQLSRFDPRAEGTTLEPLRSDVAPLPVRWIGAPVIDCDLTILQVVLDEAVTSYDEIHKSCSGSLSAQATSRPYGDNGNAGSFAPVPTCASGAGVIPCEATSGCALNPDCDDKNGCTIDACVQGTCSYKLMLGCCSVDEQCDDSDPCSENHCVNSKCFFPAALSCCEGSSDCADGNACTVDNCEDGQCQYHVDKTVEGCCTSNLDCSTNIPCAVGVCTAEKNCFLEYTPNCCNSDAGCDDGLSCTTDTCDDNGVCSHAPDPEKFSCCGEDADCDAGNPCLVPVCDINAASCSVTPIPECCLTSVQCNDKNPCTNDTCVDSKCEHVLDLTIKGCCDEDSDCSITVTKCILGVMCDVEQNLCKPVHKECKDEDDCTKDTCVEGECIFEPIPECCLTDEDCDDGDPCTGDVCDEDFHVCQHNPGGGCCHVDADCADSDPGTTSEQCTGNVCVVERCDIYDYTAIQKPLDLVFVIDQSTSMNDEIALVRTYLNQLAGWIGTAGVDYHVVLLASRKKGANMICIEEPLAGPNCENSARFVQIDEQISSHDALEQIMANIDEVEAFMRPGSSRQFIVMSDDVSNVGADEFAFFLASRPGYQGWIFHAFVGIKGLPCAKQPGTDYLDLADMTGGLAYDICETAWKDTYAELGKAGTTAGISFFLPMTPLPGTLIVTYDGQVKSEGVHWSYDPATNRVTWTDPPPTPGKTLQICLEGNPQ